MATPGSAVWISSLRDTVTSYRRMIDGTIAQLTDEELRARPADGINSVAIVLRHLGGNLRSRWTDFLSTDGEKPDRDRDAEFQDWEGDRRSLLAYFDEGWSALETALDSIDDSNATRSITIRGEPHTVAQALTRSITHLTYHVGQISLLARMAHRGEWRWLTIAPGASAAHNERTWGSAASRGVVAGATPSDINPCLTYDDAAAAIDWLCRVFGFTEQLVVPGEHGTIIHSELSLGNGVIMVSSPKPDSGRSGPRSAGGASATLSVFVPDPDAHHARCVAAGAAITTGLRDEDYGARGYGATDLEGHNWFFSNYRPGAFWTGGNG